MVVAVLTNGCRRFDSSCRHFDHCCRRFWVSPFWHVAVFVVAVPTCRRYDRYPQNHTWKKCKWCILVAGIHLERAFASMPCPTVKRHTLFCHACPSPALFSTVCAVVINKKIDTVNRGLETCAPPL